MIQRDENGVAHIVGLSGGDDSTCLAVNLNEREPRPYNYIITPTGNELPEMFDHWIKLGEMLGSRLVPIIGGTLAGVIRQEKMIPNFRARFCTRILKIEPYERFLMEEVRNGPIVSYIGLRADEEAREGGIYAHIDGVTSRFPLREWGWDDPMVLADLARRGIEIPRRTDCALCYHQRIGEWYLLWLERRGHFNEGIAIEDEMGATFRTPGRDSYPSSLRDMGTQFEAGRIPTVSLNRMKRERQQVGQCRTCSL